VMADPKPRRLDLQTITSWSTPPEAKKLPS
jgi:hypothetical protein